MWFHKVFAPIRKYCPRWIADPLRRVATAFLTPALFSTRTGHFRSSLRAKAVERDGQPLPWYSYPCIDFLKTRGCANRSVLEFGAGQSTLWWAQRAREVLSFEGDAAWYERIRCDMPGNVALHLVSMESRDACLADVERILKASSPRRFDVIVVDGLHRADLARLAPGLLSDDGMIICDNAEGYGFQAALRESGLLRVDFIGHAPGVIMPHATSIYFRPGSFAFSATHEIVVPVGSQIPAAR